MKSHVRFFSSPAIERYIRRFMPRFVNDPSAIYTHNAIIVISETTSIRKGTRHTHLVYSIDYHRAIRLSMVSTPPRTPRLHAMLTFSLEVLVEVRHAVRQLPHSKKQTNDKIELASASSPSSHPSRNRFRCECPNREDTLGPLPCLFPRLLGYTPGRLFLRSPSLNLLRNHLGINRLDLNLCKRFCPFQFWLWNKCKLLYNRLKCRPAQGS